ncbi:MAG TPA: type II toxin-antitoxin system mRNA interferase toxin, RelE/StbE family [Candidatus Pacebacteria bacterium]|nr:MAG: Addiction module toxin [Microgenomates group bacterium GW2011_GWA1_46_15]KKU24497.1 MAG: Addiction module toxin [Microgenomates group bacterium GW2011_GWC1_46_15]HAV15601.1 type II toxin-antitoxin system mRNA interferase toxin, RelE/StbE family [Candidatus Paceibacterota bacterium]HCR10927.1 type II toxin-antitoxin system mRNA interferase toxin, RelE/StbE family [Candidatus Paceibacterota bacterium]HCR92694.1 type II toxin-antitoxin system mRNA interferase toxin, RelE/StbE family [Candi
MPAIVTIIPSAKRALLKLPSGNKFQIVKKIDLLSNEPFPHGCKKLHGERDTYRLRSGDYRIIYVVHKQKSNQHISIMRIAHRKEVYKP